MTPESRNAFSLLWVLGQSPLLRSRLLSNCTAAYESLRPEIDFSSEITKFGAGTSIIGAVMWVLSYVFVATMNHAAENQERPKTIQNDTRVKV